MKESRILELVAEGLRGITLPPLRRPRVRPDEAATEELVQWGTKLYSYSVIAHVRTILSAVLELESSGNIPASWVLTRHLFEWTSHVCYMATKLEECFQKKSWGQAFELLDRAATGNYWAKQYGDKYAPDIPAPIDLPKPIRVGDLVAAYESHQLEQLGEADAKDSYSLLSEYSHPNSACLRHYHEYSVNGLDMRFREPTKDSAELLPLTRCMIELPMFLHTLLWLAKESEVRSTVLKLIKGIIAHGYHRPHSGVRHQQPHLG